MLIFFFLSVFELWIFNFFNLLPQASELPILQKVKKLWVWLVNGLVENVSLEVLTQISVCECYKFLDA